MIGGFNIGGKGIWFSKKFLLTKHNMVTIKINAIALDSWDKERFRVYADGKRIIN